MTEWIKCSDQLPEEGKNVLGYSKLWDEVASCHLSDAKNLEWRFKDGWLFEEVTHWVELPQTPKQIEKERQKYLNSDYCKYMTNYFDSYLKRFFAAYSTETKDEPS